jgi:hypothetical protein
MQVTFENICKMFASMDPSPVTDMMDGWFAGLLAGLRAFPIDFPGTAYRHARAVRAGEDILNYHVALNYSLRFFSYRWIV